MKRILIAFAIVLLGAVPVAAGKPDRAVFAIIVTNNHSNQLGRPDLRYADDDGAKYHEMFKLLAPAENIHLLAELDRDTLALFPHLATVAKQPTVRAVTDAATDVAKRARVELGLGNEVEVYFVFAGHGDVDRGVGFLELADGQFTAEDLDKHVLAGIPATRTHIVLDSCNSFFVINARKPGGRRFATPSDITETFTKKLPHVGVFLSTSAEAEVYEWSELQSGIFSHAVRSGLLGAADVNNDGTVTYKELHGFVTVAAASVKNPLYRPNVFARGPSGKNEIALVDLSKTAAVAVNIGPEQTRLTVRDRDGLPWLDAHSGQGASFTMRIPARVASGGSIEEAKVGDSQRSIKARWTLPAEAQPFPVAMAELTPAAENTTVARGPQNMLRMLFSDPYGPGALAHVQQYIVPVQVFGVAQEDAERMDLLLGSLSDHQRRQRILLGTGLVGIGTLFGGTYAYMRWIASEEGEPPPPRGWDIGFAVGTGLLFAGGAYSLLSLSEGEKIHNDYRARMALRRGDDSYIVADTERRLHELAAKHQRNRERLEIAGWIVGGVSAASLLAIEASSMSTTEKRVARMFPLMLGIDAGLLIISGRVMRTPEEQMYRLWRDDPGIRQIPRLGVAPARGGGMFTLSGSF